VNTPRPLKAERPLPPWSREQATHRKEPQLRRQSSAMSRVAPLFATLTRDMSVAARKERHSETHMTFSRKQATLEQEITIEELHFLRSAPCPVLAISQRITRAIVTRLHAGGMRAPPPIISRIFQEISNGLLAYNGATKMKEIAVPFAFVQFNALLLIVFFIAIPVSMANLAVSHTDAVADSPFLACLVIFSSVLTVGSFTALWLIANELEDPFGAEPNDMPMLQFHNEFCDSLHFLLHHSWMKYDQWAVSEGPWVNPVPGADRRPRAAAPAAT